MATGHLENVLLSLQGLNSTVPPNTRRSQFFQRIAHAPGTEDTAASSKDSKVRLHLCPLGLNERSINPQPFTKHLLRAMGRQDYEDKKGKVSILQQGIRRLIHRDKS